MGIRAYTELELPATGAYGIGQVHGAAWKKRRRLQRSLRHPPCRGGTQLRENYDSSIATNMPQPFMKTKQSTKAW